jgi:iron complex outermembrane receptor protein
MFLKQFSLLSLAALCSTSLYAQQPNYKTQKIAQDSVKKYESKEVIVSTAGRAQRLMDVPVSITAVPSEYFREGRAYEVKDALQYVPGVFAQSRSGHSDVRVTIRGFGSRGAGDRSNAGNMRGIRVLLDGLPETEPDGRTSLDMVDLNAINSVEVVRGNASSIYGSASGGVINFISGGDISTPLIESKNAFGSFGLLRNTVDASAIMGESRLFVAATRTEYDGYRDHSQASSGNVTMSLRSVLSEDTRVNLSLGAASNIFRFPGPLTKAQMEADPLQADSTYKANDDHRFNRVGRLGVTLEHDLTANQGFTATAYYMPKIITRSERNSWREFNRFTVGTMAAYNLRGNLSEDIGSQFTVGYEQQYQDGSIQFYSLGPGASRGLLTDNKKEAAQHLGFYAHDLFTISDFDLLLGARYTTVNYTAQTFLEPSSPQMKDFSLLSPKVAIGYHQAPNRTIYASFGQGMEAPAFNEIDLPGDSALVVSRGGTFVRGSAFNPIIDPAISSTIELGVKGYESMDGFIASISYDVNGFYIMTTDDIVPWNGGRYYFNAAETKRMGVELGFSIMSDMGLTLRSATTVMSNEYTKYESLFGTFDGNKMAGVPGLFGTTSLRYDAPFGMFVELAAEYVGEYYADDRNDELPTGAPDPTTNSLVDSYLIENATVGYKTGLGDFDIDVFAGLRNLTDQKYASSAFINGVNNKYFEPGMPSNFIAGLNIRYKILD